MIEINNKAKDNLDLKKIKQATEKILKNFKKQKFNVSIALVTDSEIKNWNKIYRHKDVTTDVLSFPADSNDKESNYLGEILINYQQIKRQAKDFNNTPEEELIFILVHGLLHLLDYTDDTELKKKEIINLGENLIKKLHISI